MANISTVAPYAGAGQQEASTRPGIFRRILTAIMEGQQRKADREIAAIMSRYADTPPHVLEAERERARRNYPLGQIK